MAWQKGTGIKETKYHTKIQNKTKTFQIKPGRLEDYNRFLSTTQTFQIQASKAPKLYFK
jgi:hypothetical protein